MKQTMLRRLAALCLVCLSFNCNAQWEGALSIGKPMPFSGYKGVIRGNRYLSIEAGHRFRNEAWALQLSLDWAKMHGDKNKADVFIHPKLDLISVGAGATYTFESINSIEPYAGAALGVTLYNFTYEPTVNSSRTITNASFSVLPLLGLQYRLTSSVAPFFQLKTVVLMDGPPQGFPKASKTTGYTAASIGLRYAFF